LRIGFPASNLEVFFTASPQFPHVCLALARCAVRNCWKAKNRKCSWYIGWFLWRAIGRV